MADPTAERASRILAFLRPPRAEIVALVALPTAVRERLFTVNGPGWAVFDEEDVHAGWLTHVVCVYDGSYARGSADCFLPASEGAILDLIRQMAGDDLPTLGPCASGSPWQAALVTRRGDSLDVRGTTAREACLLLLGKLAALLDRPTHPAQDTTP